MNRRGALSNFGRSAARGPRSGWRGFFARIDIVLAPQAATSRNHGDERGNSDQQFRLR
jgi:hypothetical protein